MLLRDIRLYSKLRYEGDATIGARMEMLQKHRDFVLAQQERWNEYLKNLDSKIEIYRSKLENEGEYI